MSRPKQSYDDSQHVDTALSEEEEAPPAPAKVTGSTKQGGVMNSATKVADSPLRPTPGANAARAQPAKMDPKVNATRVAQLRAQLFRAQLFAPSCSSRPFAFVLSGRKAGRNHPFRPASRPAREDAQPFAPSPFRPVSRPAVFCFFSRLFAFVWSPTSVQVSARWLLTRPLTGREKTCASGRNHPQSTSQSQ